MSMLTTALTTLPVSLVVLVLTLRYGPDVILRLLAGVVAVLAKDKERGNRALTVLKLLQSRKPR
ncbi:hypothetical protein AB0L44_31980 [Nonomuraea wenchangensis]|uniref:Uncharacterized protein n=1 Tax=Nonomuraea wenchangensis TaxID=568860 RepID=A0A1I0K731_9ACTN|nr:hypothetical protein [Nonomuraea wenchangensis]SEU18967.1 hypothetical protein SAMN05421811_10767 [Nonomuraea wenchangensis]